MGASALSAMTAIALTARQNGTHPQMETEVGPSFEVQFIFSLPHNDRLDVAALGDKHVPLNLHLSVYFLTL